MNRIILIFACALFMATGGAMGVTTRSVANTAARGAANFVTPTAYNTMYPAMNNTMRTTLNPGATPNFTGNSVSTLTRTSNVGDTRRVVSRPGAARAATSSGTSQSATVARSGTTPAATATGQNRRVVARANTTQNTHIRSARGDNSIQNRGASNNTTTSNTETLPAARCLADYTQCMNGYCARENMSYNRCYCSARLAQIDAEYQPEIDRLIRKILELQNGADIWTAEEMNQYWEDMVGKYTGDNSWTNLDNALDINWAGTESRVRGQQSFITGHEYCVQHLRGCFYMADNMRDAYRSEIARDCAAYENSLQKIKIVAESLVEAYTD